jgi:undecaprenyl-diphosphatase
MSARLQDDDSALGAASAERSFDATLDSALDSTSAARARLAWRQRAALSLELWSRRAAQSRLQWSQRDLDWTARMNRVVLRPFTLLPMLLASRLGDGGLWYATMLGLALFGDSEARLCATRMALAGLLCVTLYKWTKAVIARPRPYVRCVDIRRCGRALDQFSFPSGHVLHAVAFSLILVQTYPMLGWVLGPFVVLVALSRVTLGLHYPSDVAAGAAIGAALAGFILTVL